MAWYAELKRRKWYCINGFDMVSWYSQKLYDEWWESLTEEQRHIVEENHRKRKEREFKEARTTLAKLMVMSSLVQGLNNRR